jgi:hypothetical protein
MLSQMNINKLLLSNTGIYSIRCIKYLANSMNYFYILILKFDRYDFGQLTYKLFSLLLRFSIKLLVAYVSIYEDLSFKCRSSKFIFSPVLL